MYVHMSMLHVLIIHVTAQASRRDPGRETRNLAASKLTGTRQRPGVDSVASGPSALKAERAHEDAWVPHRSLSMSSLRHIGFIRPLCLANAPRLPWSSWLMFISCVPPPHHTVCVFKGRETGRSNAALTSSGGKPAFFILLGTTSARRRSAALKPAIRSCAAE